MLQKGEMRDEYANSKEEKKKRRLECKVANFM